MEVIEISEIFKNNMASIYSVNLTLMLKPVLTFQKQ